MTRQSAAQAKQENIAEMGEALGAQHAELWQDIAHLHFTWLEYVELFGTKTSRVELLIAAAPDFFLLVRDRLWESVMLQIARLTDKPESFGNKNLSLLNLPALIDDQKLKAEVESLCTAAVARVKFARDRRNRSIAHRDLKLALEGSAKPLPAVAMKQVDDALASFQAMLNAISLHFSKPESGFGLAPRNSGALHLIYLMDDGLTAQKEQRERMKAGDLSWRKFKDL